MKVRKFTRKWKIGAVATMLASLSLGVAVGCGETEAPEITKGLGMFYFDAGIEEYQLSLGDGNKVTFIANGEIKTGTYVNDGSTVTFKFDGEEAETTATIEGDTLTWTYNANEQMRFFKKVYYTVSYDEQNGSEVADATVINGQTVSKPADPVREGYEFLGWYTDEACTTPFMFDTQIVTGNVTLYASWAMITPGAVAYTVDFDLGYEGGNVPAPIDTISGKLYGAPTVERQGYVFRGWWMSDYEDGNKLTRPYTPDMIFNANTTLFAVWESENLGQKLSAPNVQVTDTGITWDGVSGARLYRVKVTGPEGFLTISEDSPATSIAIDFANAPAGDYNIEVTAVAYDESNNSDKVVRGFINKAVGRVSQFTVLDGKVLLFNRVEKAEVYYVTVECGNSSHNHVLYNNGDSTYYSFLNCDMQEGGIRFTVTASADGYADVVSETFVYNRSLDKVEGLMVDDETQMLTWYPVKDATNYIVSISCDNAAHNHSYVNVGTKTYFSLKECYDVDGDIKINVYAQTKGYNSPEPTEYSYTKTKMATPSNVSLTSVGNRYIVSWNAVNAAAGETTYSIKIGNEIFTTNETSYDITDAVAWIPDEKYTVSVKASVGTNESVWSDPIDAYYYAMAGKVSYKSGVVSWQSVLGATGYEVKVNEDGAIMTVTDAYANVTFTKAGTNTIYVRFIDETKNYYSPVWFSCEVANVMPIVFDSRGGTDVAMQYKASGDPIELPQPTREGYTFAGWYNTPKGPDSNGAVYDAILFEENSELVLYAYWTPAQYSLSYITGEGGKLPDGVTAGQVTYTMDYKLDVPEVEDATKVFLGWFAGSSAESEQLTDDRGYSLKPWNVKAGATVYAQYVSNALSFSLLENGTYSVTKGVNANKLTSITIPQMYNNKPVTVVDGYAFMQCSKLVTINIPDTIEIIVEENAFQGCKRLEEINIIPTGNKLAVYSSVDGVLLHKNEITSSMELCYFPQAKVGSYAIPEGVTEIPLKVFENAKITEITIPATVSIIRSNAFMNCAQLEKIIFSEGGNVGLTIEDGAFQDCKVLKSITLPARLNELQMNEELHTMSIFAGCSALTHINVERGNQVYASIDGVITNKAGDTIIFCPTARKGVYSIPQTIVAVGEYAFANCNLLTKVIIPESVEVIGEYAFADCARIAIVQFGDGQSYGTSTEIGEYAFAGLTSLSKVEFGANSVVTKIGAYAFSGAKSLKELKIPSTMQEIGDYAFENAKALGAITFMDGNSGSLKFGNYVFSECTGLTSVQLPKSVKELNLGVFDGCVNIAAIKVAEENEYYRDIDGVVFTKNCDELIFFPKGKKVEGGEYVLPASVEKISEGAFRGARYVETIEIGKNVTYIGKYAFEDSISLTALTFAADGTAALTIDDMAFAGCAAITSVSLPDRTVKIGTKAFYNVGMTSVTFPANLTEIGDFAFARTAITSVEIPANITSFGEHVFDTCSKLTTVTFAAGYTGTEIPVGTFKATAITAIEIPASIEKIGYTAFNDCVALTTVNFVAGDAPLVIGYNDDEDVASTEMLGVFMNCSSLTTVNLPDRATVIGTYAFAACKKLNTVAINATSNLQRFGNNAFYGCTALTSIYIPASVQNSAYVDESTTQEYAIGKHAFGSSGIASVTFANDGTGALSIAEGAFAGTKLTTINLPSRLAPIYIVDTTNGFYAAMYDGISNSVFASGSQTLMSEINIAAGGQYYGSMSGVVYRVAERNGEYVMNELMIIPANCNSTIVVPYTVTLIGQYANESINQSAIQSTTTPLATIKFEETPEGVTPVELVIGHNAFSNVKSLTTVEFPERLTAIGKNAFSGCYNLTEINLPASLTKLGVSAFAGSSSNRMKATKITFAKGIQLTEIPNYAFQYCSSVTSIEIPASVEVIADAAFNYCSALTTLKFETGSALRQVEGNAFSGMQVTSLALPDSFTTIEGNIFGTSNSTLQELTLPKTFVGFTTVVGGQNRFFLNGMSALKAVHIHPENPYFWSGEEGTDDYGVVYTKSAAGGRGNELVYYPRAKQTSSFTYTTPAGVQTIGTYAFYQNTKLQKLIISEDLTSIGYESFAGCSYLTTIQFADSDSPLVIGDHAFQSCVRLNGVVDAETGLKTFKIPANVVFDGDAIFASSFSNSSVSNVYVVFEPGNESTALSRTFQSCTKIVGVQNIPATLSAMTSTFSGCTGLTTATFENDPNGYITTMAGAFKGCTKLTSIDLPAIGALTNATQFTTGNWSTTAGVSGAFQGCTKLVSVTIRECTMLGVGTFAGCSVLESVELPDNIVSIGIGSFDGCKKLKSIDLPTNLDEIGDYAFRNCAALTSISIPNFVTSIGYAAFEGCTNVSSLELGDSVVSIDARAFYGLSAVKEVEFPNTVETIGDYAFYNCSSIKALDFPSSVESIGAYAFAECINVLTITGAENASTFGDYAFANCSKVESFIIPDGLMSLGIGVFSGWDSLKDLQSGGNMDYAFKDGVLYNSSYTKIIFVTDAVQGEFAIPEGITELSEALFANTKITSVVIPDTITEIPARTFENCKQLVSVDMPAALQTIGAYAFKGCTSLKEITIPKTVRSTFDKVEWGGGKEFGYEVHAFQDGIGAYAFGGCTSLENVIFEAGGVNRLSIGGFAFYGCTSLKGVQDKTTGEYTFTIPSRVRSEYVPDYLFVGKYGFGSGDSHRRIFQGIGIYAFACSGLENVVFEDQSGVVMPEKLAIDIGAFYECASLKSVYFGDTIGNLEIMVAGERGMTVYTRAALAENVFYGCRSLQEVTFSKNAATIYAAETAFDGYRPNGVEFVAGAYGTDYGEGKADWQDSGTRIFSINGCTSCGNCKNYQPHNGIYDLFV